MLDLKSMNDNDLVNWLGSFADKLKGSASKLGVKDTDVEAVEHDSKTFSTLVRAEDEVKSRNLGSEVTNDLKKYKDFARNGADDELRQKFPAAFEPIMAAVPAGIMPRLIGFLENLKGRSGYTPQIGSDIGMVSPDGKPLAQMVESHDDVQTARWLDKVVNGLKGHKQTLGISDSEMEEVEKSHYAYSQLVHQNETAKHEGAPQSLLQKLGGYLGMMKNGPSSSVTSAFPALAPMALAVVPGIVPRITALLDHLKGKPGFASIAGSLGITEVSHPEPTAAVREHVPERRGVFPTWLVPLLLLALVGLLAWRLWPKQIKAGNVTQPTKPAQMTQLKVYGVKAEPMAKGGVISWQTNEKTTSQIEYGRTQSLELSHVSKVVSGQKMTTDHSVKLSDLAPKTRYYYRVRSTDAAGRTAASDIHSFITP